MEGISNEKWNEIRECYAGGGITQRELSERYGVPIGTLRKKAAQEHWAHMRKLRSAGAQDDPSARGVRLGRQLAITDRLLEVILAAVSSDDELFCHVEFSKGAGGSEFVCQRMSVLDEERLGRIVKAVSDICELQRVLLGIHDYRDELTARKLEQEGTLASRKLEQDGYIAGRKLDIELLKLESSDDGEQSPEDFIAALMGGAVTGESPSAV